MTRIRALGDWMFRDRATGTIVIAQFPNIPLLAWLAATGLTLLTTGVAHAVLSCAAAAALVVWAGDELLRGVNPFRRLLGAAVLGVEVVSLIRGG